jgi:hypothetical protein
MYLSQLFKHIAKQPFGDHASVAAAFVALISATISVWAYRAQKKQTKTDVLIRCIERYIKIREGRTKSMRDSSLELAEDYYRELFDLLWLEFHVWKSDLINRSVMKKWLEFRYQYWEDDDKIKITVKKDKENENKDKDKKKEIDICYKTIWGDLVEEKYFGKKNDPFVRFVNKVHENKIKQAMYKHSGRIWLIRIYLLIWDSLIDFLIKIKKPYHEPNEKTEKDAK